MKKVAVIGAGIVGVSTALHLQTRGYDVSLIDPRPAGTETSHGNAGIIDGGHILPFGFPAPDRWPGILAGRNSAANVHWPSLPGQLGWLLRFFLNSPLAHRTRQAQALRPLLAASLAEHRHLMDAAGCTHHLLTTGRVLIYRDQTSFEADAHERQLAQQWGVTCDVFGCDEFRQLEPLLKPAFHTAVRWPDSWRVNNPGAVVAAYASHLSQRGGSFLRHEVKTLQPASGGWQVQGTNGLDLHADQVVLCTGPWSADILNPLGYCFPLAGKRGYHAHYRLNGAAQLNHALVDTAYGYVLVGMEQGLRLTTGVEFAARHVPPRPVQLAQVVPHARELVDFGDQTADPVWLGARPCLPDNLPVIGKAPRHQGLWFNFGHGHFGFTLGPASGRLMAELMTGAPAFTAAHAFSAERYTQGKWGG